MSKHQIAKRIRNNANYISLSIMVLQTNTMTCPEICDKMPPQASGGFAKFPTNLPQIIHESSLGIRETFNH